MPIDPREFKRIVTNHFATVTDEEFLENLRKSSPYLFTEDPEKQQDDRISESHLPVDRINPTPKFNLPRVPGQDKGNVIISPEFDDPFPADKMLDINKSKEILENYFANLTREQFAIDLEKYCPELVKAELANLGSETAKNIELYQQAKQESKLEIAPKLLKKGMSIQEVAELLELDVQLLAK